MNYIKQLQEENARLKAKQIEMQKELNSFFAFLHSDKFTGVQSDGARKDWIATGDVIRWVQDTKNLLVD